MIILVAARHTDHYDDSLDSSPKKREKKRNKPKVKRENLPMSVLFHSQ
jgi:hypothetical protein